ncbi:hypothetical protein D9M71_604330 [compost metagenome]
MHAKVRARRYGIVGAVDRPEQAHGRQDQCTHQHTQHNRGHAGLERQAEQHRETTQYSGGEGVGTAEYHAKQIAGTSGPFVIGNLFDPEGFNLAYALRAVVVIHDLLRSFVASCSIAKNASLARE